MTLAVDQSTSNFAWTLFDDNGNMKDFGVWSPEKKWDEFKKLHWLIEQVDLIDQKYTLKTLLVESLPYGAQSVSVRVLAGLFYMLGVWAYTKQVKFYDMVITKIKKCATGKGNALKVEMYKAMPEDIQQKFLGYQLSKTTEKKQENIKERYDNMLENEKYFKSNTFLTDMSDSYWIHQIYKGECK